MNDVLKFTMPQNPEERVKEIETLRMQNEKLRFESTVEFLELRALLREASRELEKALKYWETDVELDNLIERIDKILKD